MTRNAQEENGYTLDSISHSVEQTQRLGMRLGELLKGGELILLEGQLGTGKTTFTQGLALGMEITANINSPTFTILKEYPGQPPRRNRPVSARRSIISICTAWMIPPRFLTWVLKSIFMAKAFVLLNGLTGLISTGLLTTCAFVSKC